MDAGTMPTYVYRPSDTSPVPRMNTHSGRRARWFGDTYARVKEPGRAGNNISMFTVRTGLTGKLIVINHNTLVAQSVIGSYKPIFQFLDTSGLLFDQEITCTAIDSTTFNVVDSKNPSKTHQMRPGELLMLSEGVSICIASGDRTVNSGDTFKLVARVQEFPLKWVTVSVTNPESGTSTEYKGFDIELLRAAVSGSTDSWIAMPARSFKDGAPIVVPPIDAQDEEEDAHVLDELTETYFSGGDGLPDIPDGQKTGPSRSIVHLNYSEVDDGTMGVVSKVYEWSGDTNTVGEWLALF